MKRRAQPYDPYRLEAPSDDFGRHEFMAPSASRAGVRHEVWVSLDLSASGCTCEAATFGKVCSHQHAARLRLVCDALAAHAAALYRDWPLARLLADEIALTMAIEHCDTAVYRAQLAVLGVAIAERREESEEAA